MANKTPCDVLVIILVTVGIDMSHKKYAKIIVTIEAVINNSKSKAGLQKKLYDE